MTAYNRGFIDEAKLNFIQLERLYTISTGRITYDSRSMDKGVRDLNMSVLGENGSRSMSTICVRRALETLYSSSLYDAKTEIIYSKRKL